MRLQKSPAGAAAALLLVSSLGFGGLTAAAASPAPSAGMHGQIRIGPTGNKVEIVDPSNSTYVPNIAAASARDRARSQRLLDGVNAFCRAHTAAQIKSKWRPGLSKTTRQTHWFNPSPKSWGLNPNYPRAVLVYKGRIGGVMFSGSPLPHLGSIPRPHSHMMDSPMEMLHVYCTPSLKEAFTPNRVLGVKAATIALRLTIRPAVMDLTRHQLRQVRAKVRAICGDKLKPVYPSGPSASGPDPVLQAMRTEIRESLMLMHERQLRSVWRLMQSYHR